MAKKEWWQTIFGDKYLTTYVDSFPQKRTELEVDFLTRVLRPKGGKVLDLACGHGRHSIELAKKGYTVTGLDYSRHFLRLVKERAREKGVRAVFRQGDMRKLSFKNEFNYIINMFTSFGYFKAEEDHAKVLRGVARALKKNGLFVMDFNNSLRGCYSGWLRGAGYRKTREPLREPRKRSYQGESVLLQNTSSTRIQCTGI